MDDRRIRRAEKGVPDCRTCIESEGCVWAIPGHYCLKWRSKEPEKREPDPNKAWERGDETEFM